MIQVLVVGATLAFSTLPVCPPVCESPVCSPPPFPPSPPPPFLTNVVPGKNAGNPCKNPGFGVTRNPIQAYTDALTGTCELVDNLTYWEIPQTGIDVTPGTAKGLIDPNFDPKPLSKALDPETGGCVVNLHYHLGTEHYNNATFSEDGAAFLHKVMQCERANYKDMEKDNLMLNGELLTYNNLSDTVFCCEMRNRNYLPLKKFRHHLLTLSMDSRIGGDLWEKFELDLCEDGMKATCCRGDPKYSGNLFSDEPIFTEDAVTPEHINTFEDAGHFCQDAVQAYEGNLTKIDGIPINETEKEMLTEMYTTPYNFEHCVEDYKSGSIILRRDGTVSIASNDSPDYAMHVGFSYEFHWPHSTLGACGTEWQYQAPFQDGVFCKATAAGMSPDDAVKALLDEEHSIGVMAQVFTVVNEDYVTAEMSHRFKISSLQPGYFGSTWNMSERWHDEIATDQAVYQGSSTNPTYTTGKVVDDGCKAIGGLVTWHIDRACHLITAQKLDAVCKELTTSKYAGMMDANGVFTDISTHPARDTKFNTKWVSSDVREGPLPSVDE